MARDSCPSLCGCKLSGTPVELVERLGRYRRVSMSQPCPPAAVGLPDGCGARRSRRPDEYAVITTGNTNVIRSIELPAIRGAILYCHEPPLYFPVLAAHAAGDMALAAELEAYIGKVRRPSCPA